MVPLRQPLTLAWPAAALALLAQFDGNLGRISQALLSIYLMGVIVLLLVKLCDQIWQDRYWLIDAIRGHNINIHQSRVRALFDSYAKRFDDELRDGLGYRGPELAARLLAQIARPERQFDVVDLGCGTGLAATTIKPFARNLKGCDLSKAMLDKARARLCYDELQQADLIDYLKRHEAGFDLALALDVLIYVDQGFEFFRAAHRALRPSGLLIATTELPSSGPIGRVRGRRQEARDVTISIAAAAGFELARELEDVLRFEAGKPVAAGIYLWRRRP